MLPELSSRATLEFAFGPPPLNESDDVSVFFSVFVLEAVVRSGLQRWYCESLGNTVFWQGAHSSSFIVSPRLRRPIRDLVNARVRMTSNILKKEVA